MGELLKVISSCNNLKSLRKAVEVPSQAGRVPVGIFYTPISFLGSVEKWPIYSCTAPLSIVTHGRRWIQKHHFSSELLGMGQCKWEAQRALSALWVFYQGFIPFDLASCRSLFVPFMLFETLTDITSLRF